MRSSWESRFASWCDSNPSVLKWGSETRSIPYFSQVDKRVRNYYIDFFVLIKNKKDEMKRYMVEIKPREQIEMPVKRSKKSNKYLQELCVWQRNQDKWKAATQFARKNGAEFIILDEQALGIR